MLRKRVAVLLGVTIALACAEPGPERRVECDADNGGLTLAPGFCAVVVADNLGRIRHLAVSANGDVYARLRMPADSGGIVALRDTTGDGRADVVQRFLSGSGSGIGIRGPWLYYTTDAEIHRIALPTDGALVPTGAPELIASGFPDQRRHSPKPIAFDDSNGLYVTVGAPTNACQPVAQDNQHGVPGQNPCPELPLQGGVWKFDAERTGQMQGTDGEAYALGVRNAMAIAWHSGVNGLYIVQHGRDILDQIAPDHFTAEENATKPGELLYRLSAGDTLMHPYCFWDLDQERAVVMPEYGGDGEMVGDCGGYPAPLAAYPAHWAPNGLHFYTGTLFPERFRGGAFIAFHGSWNRAPLPMAGYRIVFQPMTNGAPSGEFETFADNFAGAPSIASIAEAAYRPVGVTEGPDGSLYVSDDVKGRIWRIVPAAQ
jgi:glucose/arabinose dehydrogenase